MKHNCVARDALLYGSKACFRARGKHSDLCKEHEAALLKLSPSIQVIDGTVYIGTEDQELREEKKT